MTFVIRVLEYLLLSIFIAPFSLKFARMDKKGSAAAFFVGLLVYISLGLSGFVVLFSLHLIGALATRFGYDKKSVDGVAQKKRSAENVVANGFFPTFAAVISMVLPSYRTLLFVVYASTVAAATADTVSSEIGELSDKKPRLITTLQEVDTGTDGGISTLGTVSGAIASVFIAVIALLFESSIPAVEALVTVTLAGLIGTTVDSFLGATLERRGKMGNDAVNFFSIGVSFIFSIAFYSLVG